VARVLRFEGKAQENEYLHLGKSPDFIGNGEKFSVGIADSDPNKRFSGGSLRNAPITLLKTLGILGFN